MVPLIDMADKRLSQLHWMIIENSQTEKQKEKRLKKTLKNPTVEKNYKNCNVHVIRILERKKRLGQKKHLK